MEARSREALAHELLRLAQCPVEWIAEDRFGDPADFFHWDWLQVYRQHAADREDRWIEDPFRNPMVDLGTEPIDDIAADLSNLRARAPIAAREYVHRSRRFWALRAADPREHPKHYPPGGLAWAAIAAQTRGGVSLLKPGVGPGQLVEAFWFTLTELSNPFDEEARHRLREKLLAHAVTRIAVELPSPVGAAYGAETRHLCFELDASTPLLHAYPISLAEGVELGAVALPAGSCDFGLLDDVSMREMTQRPYGHVRADFEMSE